MKRKTFCMAMLLAAATGHLHAQQQYVWDFTHEVSGETAANLDADDNWVKSGTNANGQTTSWYNKNLDVITSYGLTANGQVLFDGLQFSMGTNTNKQNNFLLKRNGTLRLTRNDMRIMLPNLYNGQTVTITGKSANATATDRGIKPVQSYVELTSGNTTDGQCLFLGSDVEGSLDVYTFTWTVNTGIDEPMPVAFTLINGGIELLTVAVNVAETYTHTFTVDNVTYEYDDDSNGEVKVIGVTTSYDSESQLVGPETVNVPDVVVNPFNNQTYTVTSMQARAFNVNGVKHVKLPDGITEIPNSAFSNNSWLETIELPHCLTRIGTSAFQRCTALQEVHISSADSSVPIDLGEGYNFRYCTSLRTVNMMYAAITTVPTRMFSDCPSLADVGLPLSCEEIGAAAFLGAGISSLVLPAGVKKIDSWAFSDCQNLKYIVSIPGTAPTIKGDSFSEATWQSAELFVGEGGTASYLAASNWNRMTKVSEILTDDKNETVYLQNVATGRFLNYNASRRLVLADKGTALVLRGTWQGTSNYETNYVFELEDQPGRYICISAENDGAWIEGYSTWMLVKGGQPGTVRLRYNVSDHEWNSLRTYLSADSSQLTDELNTVGSEDDYSLWRMITPDELAHMQANAIFAESITVRPGSEAVLPLSLKNAESIQGIQFDIQLPEGVSIVKSGRKWPVTMNEERAGGHSVSGEDKGNGRYRFVITGQNAIEGNDGNVMDITLQVADDMAEGDYTLTLSDIELSTADSQAITPDDYTATITVRAYTPGDVNNDGTVTVTDVTAIINYLLGKTSGVQEVRAADVNGDGTINITDVTAAINIILKR